MKETIVACVTFLLLFFMLFVCMAIDSKLKNECTVAGMMAGFTASEIRSACNIK